MKNIEDKLDSFEQVLTVLIKKISLLEECVLDSRVSTDDTTQTMLVDIQVNLAKMPSRNMLISELAGIQKLVSALSDAGRSPTPVVFKLRTKAYFVSLAVMICTTVASLTAIRCSHSELERGQHIAAKYEAAQVLAPSLTRLIDTSFNEAGQPSIDSLRRAWELMNSERRETDNARRNKR